MPTTPSARPRDKRKPARTPPVILCIDSSSEEEKEDTLCIARKRPRSSGTSKSEAAAAAPDDAITVLSSSSEPRDLHDVATRESRASRKEKEGSGKEDQRVETSAATSSTAAADPEGSATRPSHASSEDAATTPSSPTRRQDLQEPPTSPSSESNNSKENHSPSFSTEPSDKNKAEETLLKRNVEILQAKERDLMHRIDQDIAQQEQDSTGTHSEQDSRSSSHQPVDYNSHCWSCQVQVKGKSCLYALHVHPSLQVPVCCLCADEAASQTTDESCAGCCTEEATLFLCDNCPLAFCADCVTRAHGNNTSVCDRLSQEEEPWHCLVCAAPPALKQLQRTLEHAMSQESPKEVSAETLLEELDRLELELAECDQAEASEEAQRALIACELKEELNELPLQERDERIQEEFQLWMDQWTNHQRRLADRVASVQTELERAGVDLSSVYKWQREGKLKEDTIEEPEWKVAADRVLDKAETFEYRHSDPQFYNQDLDEGDYDLEIEDLQTTDDLRLPDSDQRKQWRQMGTKVDQGKLETALRSEDEHLQRNKIPIAAIVDDKADETSFIVEEKTTSSRAAFTRIRRDACQMVVQRQKELKPRKKRARLQTVATLSQKSKTSAPLDAIQRLSQQDHDDTEMATEPFHPPASNKLFQDSSLVLCEGTGDSSRRTVSVATPLAKALKEHQVEGVKFMWSNVCPDLAYTHKSEYDSNEVGGCLLSHNMGLGKSLQVICLLHTLLDHPCLVAEDGSRIIRRAMLIVPVNTIANWENEFAKWVDELYPSTNLYNLNDVNQSSRPKTIRKWKSGGGVLLMGDRLYPRILTQLNEADIGPDIVVLDEAHTMLKTVTSEISKALRMVRTPRRVALTGTPMSNNLLEYFRMASWVRPGCLGTEAQFDKQYNRPIIQGMASDSAKEAVGEQVRLSKKLHSLMAPFTHRRDRTVLSRTLPPMQQVVLYVRQSKVQARLYRAFQKSHKVGKNLTFFEFFQKIRPLHNHPACYLSAPKYPGRVRSASPRNVEETSSGVRETNETDPSASSSLAVDPKVSERPLSAEPTSETFMVTARSSKIGLDKENSVDNGQWWSPIAAKMGKEKLNKVESGYKVVLLLQILVHADALGEKVLVFSQCLRTLNFIEEVLNMEDWGRFVPDLDNISGSCEKYGNWRKNDQYLRIDGAVSASDRGNLVDSFNCGDGPRADLPLGMESNNNKLFLLSIEAGGLGINLTAASRVVIFDNHWNPSVTEQALFRCYRYGQTKPVFAYRFVTEGSIEEKIYSRVVNKSGLAARVVDQKYPERSFSEKELRDMEGQHSWVACDRCEKWRMLPSEADAENLPEKWFCEMNDFDTVNNSCAVSEKNTLWYEDYFEQCRLRQADENYENNPAMVPIESISDDISDELKQQSIKRDAILTHILQVTNTEKSSGGQTSNSRGKSLVSKIQFHDTLLEDTRADLSPPSSQNEELESSSKPIAKSRPSSPPEEILGTWIRCSRCDKLRMLPTEADAKNLPETWVCDMNTFDEVNNNCDASEKNTQWYVDYFEKCRRLQASILKMIHSRNPCSEHKKSNSRSSLQDDEPEPGPKPTGNDRSDAVSESQSDKTVNSTVMSKTKTPGSPLPKKSTPAPGAATTLRSAAAQQTPKQSTDRKPFSLTKRNATSLEKEKKSLFVFDASDQKITPRKKKVAKKRTPQKSPTKSRSRASPGWKKQSPSLKKASSPAKSLAKKSSGGNTKSPPKVASAGSPAATSSLPKKQLFNELARKGLEDALWGSSDDEDELTKPAARKSGEKKQDRKTSQDSSHSKPKKRKVSEDLKPKKKTGVTIEDAIEID